ncbi:MAG TPA: hypothetical protein VJL59_22690 [Anaerolineales bacterium]|nr:hypothetical protein [Anaerolineales bacterium]
MPHINEIFRLTVDRQIDDLLAQITKHATEDQGAVFNYAVCRLFEGLIPGLRYKHMRGFVGDLVIALLEIYTRVIKPSEDDAITRNSSAFTKRHP